MPRASAVPRRARQYIENFRRRISENIAVCARACRLGAKRLFYFRGKAGPHAVPRRGIILCAGAERDVRRAASGRAPRRTGARSLLRPRRQGYAARAGDARQRTACSQRKDARPREDFAAERRTHGRGERSRHLRRPRIARRAAGRLFRQDFGRCALLGGRDAAQGACRRRKLERRERGEVRRPPEEDFGQRRKDARPRRLARVFHLHVRRRRGRAQRRMVRFCAPRIFPARTEKNLSAP